MAWSFSGALIRALHCYPDQGSQGSAMLRAQDLKRMESKISLIHVLPATDETSMVTDTYCHPADFLLIAATALPVASLDSAHADPCEGRHRQCRGYYAS